MYSDTIVGRCAFNYHNPDTQTFYVTLPNDTSQLNSFMCSGLNRTGLLCSQCQQGLGPAILSFKRQYVECFDQRYGWLLERFIVTHTQAGNDQSFFCVA